MNIVKGSLPKEAALDLRRELAEADLDSGRALEHNGPGHQIGNGCPAGQYPGI
jgi:hypothetical protein